MGSGSVIEVIGLVLIAILAENMVLVRCLDPNWVGTGGSTEDGAWHTGVSVTLVMVAAALASWLINTYVLRYFGMEYLRLLVYALLVPAVIVLIKLVLRGFFPVLHRHLADYLSQVVSNCAVLGVSFFITLRNYTLFQTLVYATASGLGVLLILVIFAGLRDQASFDNCPKPFRGYPIALITAGLMAMALMGFYGLHMS